MRKAWFIAVLMGLPYAMLADDTTGAGTGETPAPPPSYQILRFNENYSCLANPALRTDLFDSVKYIPLAADEPDVYLTLGGELRERFEGMSNPDFGLAGTHDSYWLQRVTLLGDLHLGPRLRFFVEGISGVSQGQMGSPPPPQQDPLDLQFAFMDIVPYLTDNESLTLRAGRFGMSLGSGRLVATRAAPNIPFKFDGFELLYSRPLWEATAFLVRPVNENPYRFSNDDDTIAFWGLYVTHWLDAPHKLGIDLYYLGIEREHGFYASGTGYELRHSFGTRLFGEKDGWDWNGEAVLQTGVFGNESILAWTASLDAGYTWNAPLQPRLGLKADVTSGDRNPDGGTQGTFDALYFKSGYFNDASLLRPENLIDLHPNLSAKLAQNVSLDGGADVFWRYSQNDAIYAPPGFIAVPAIRSGSLYVGTALDVNLQWQLQKHVTFEASYVHFFSGDYIHQAGGGDVNYVSATMTFLF